MTSISEVTVVGGEANVGGVLYEEGYIREIKDAGAKTIFPLNVVYPIGSGSNYVAIGGVNAAGGFMNEIVLPCPPHCSKNKLMNYYTAKALVEAG